MGSKHVCLMLYWGGEIINGKQGWTYDKPHGSDIILKEGSSYSELVDKVFSLMANDSTPFTLKIICRCPLFVTTTTCNYFLHEIKDNGSLEFAMATIFNVPFVNAIDLYIYRENGFKLRCEPNWGNFAVVWNVYITSADTMYSSVQPSITAP